MIASYKLSFDFAATASYYRLKDFKDCNTVEELNKKILTQSWYKEYLPNVWFLECAKNES